MVLGKKVTIFDWEWGQNSAPRDGQKRPWNEIMKCNKDVCAMTVEEDQL